MRQSSSPGSTNNWNFRKLFFQIAVAPRQVMPAPLNVFLTWNKISSKKSNDRSKATYSKLQIPSFLEKHQEAQYKFHENFGRQSFQWFYIFNYIPIFLIIENRSVFKPLKQYLNFYNFFLICNRFYKGPLDYTIYILKRALTMDNKLLNTYVHEIKFLLEISYLK